MNDVHVRDALRSAYADVVLPDPAGAVLRRGNHVRRARRASRAAYVAVAGATAVAVGVSLAAPEPPAPVRLVAHELPALPVSLSPVPPGLELSFDYDSGRLIAMYADQARDTETGGADLSLRTTDGPRSDAEATAEEEVQVQGEPGRLYLRDLPGSDDDQATVTWQTSDGWVSLTGRGRFASKRAVLAQAANVTDQPLPLDMRLDVAPAGWELIGYKVLPPDGAVLAISDDGEADADARRITVALRSGVPEPLDPGLMEDPGPVSSARVAGRVAQVMEGSRGWFLQAPLEEGGYFTLQAPKDLTRDQVVQMASGVRRS